MVFVSVVGSTAPLFDPVMGRPVTLEGKDIPIQEAIAKCSSQLGVHCLISPELRGSVSVNFRDESLDRAVSNLLPAGFKVWMAGSVLVVGRPDHPPNLLTLGFEHKRRITHHLPTVHADPRWVECMLENEFPSSKFWVNGSELCILTYESQIKAIRDRMLQLDTPDHREIADVTILLYQSGLDLEFAKLVQGLFPNSIEWAGDNLLRIHGRPWEVESIRKILMERTSTLQPDTGPEASTP